MAKTMETTILQEAFCWDYIRIYRKNGKENGNYHIARGFSLDEMAGIGRMEKKMALL